MPQHTGLLGSWYDGSVKTVWVGPEAVFLLNAAVGPAMYREMRYHWPAVSTEIVGHHHCGTAVVSHGYNTVAHDSKTLKFLAELF